MLTEMENQMDQHFQLVVNLVNLVNTIELKIDKIYSVCFLIKYYT